MSAGFVHLNVLSSFSLLEGALSIAKLADRAKADRMPCVALTDINNLFGALEFSEKMAGVGIQPIVGLSLAVEFGDREGPIGNRRAVGECGRLTLLARSEHGYRQLMALSSAAFLGTDPSERPHVLLDRLAAESSGLLALTGGPDGPLDALLGEGLIDLAAKRLDRLRGLFGDRLYVELQRHGMRSEQLAEPGLIDLAYAQGIALVATNGCRFAAASDFEAHDALICIASGKRVSETDRRQLTPEHRFKTRAEMLELFADLPEATASTVEIAQRCAFRPYTRKPILPRFGGAADIEVDEGVELRRRAAEGLRARLAVTGPAPGSTVEEYQARLEYELGVIDRMGYPGYFLIVADFIQWAKAQGIPVGPGRGSGAGSLAAYSLTITDLDPIRFGLIFERFLNPERVSMPDFDIDFCQDRRDEVIAYVQQRYGADRVAQIITFGTLQARGVMRDTGRVLEMPYGQVDKLCKLVPQNPAAPVTLGKAIEGEPRLQAAAEEPIVGRMLGIAQKLEGLYRHASTHAAGIVIADRPLNELVPLYRDPRSPLPVTQFNMKWVEQAGLVKFDFLGLKTLTVLRLTVDLLRERGVELDLAAIPLDDEASFAALSRGETVGVFQVESGGMRRALIDMRPDRLEDLIALVALYRPGPMANIPIYCARKHGKERVEYLHPRLAPILENTFGVITYQEQVMQIARDLAGYSFGEADLLRRAMGKKIRAEMDVQRGRFVSGAVEQGILKSDADAIFDACAKFADYGFNKSHSAPYALITYQTAYLKANYPAEFLAASMTLDMGQTDKLAEFKREAERLGIKVHPPSINDSTGRFEVREGAVRYAMSAVRGVGSGAVQSVVASRQSGRFRTLDDLARRLDPRALPKRALESLIAAGALDDLVPDRARAMGAAETIMAIAGRERQAEAEGQNDFFAAARTDDVRLPDVESWSLGERLKREYEAIGFFLSGHPLDDYASVLARLRVKQWAAFCESVRAGATAGRLAATVLDKVERRTKSGNKIGILTLSDQTGHYEAVIFSEELARCRDLLEPNCAIVATVRASLDGDDVRVRVEQVESLEESAAKLQSSVRVVLHGPDPLDRLIRRLDQGDGEVNIVLRLEDASEVEIRLPGRYRVSPQVAGAIRAIPGVLDVQAA